MKDWRRCGVLLGNAQFELGTTARPVAGRDASTMGPRNRFNDCKTNAAAAILAGARRVFSPKQAEDILHCQRAQAGSTVHHADHAEVAHQAAINIDNPATLCMSTGVGDEGERGLTHA